jgi:hypothetical protein
MRRRRFLVVAASLATALLAAPTATTAEGEPDTGAFAAFRVKGTHGYSFLVLATSRRGFRHGEVLLFAGRGKVGVVYLAPARVTATRIETRLGGVGRISLEFEPRGEERTIHDDCGEGGGRITYQPGAWVGSFEFEGEHGYTRAEASRVPALADPFGSCGAQVESESEGPGLPGAKLVARSASKRQSIFVQANANRPGGRLRLQAAIEERKSRLIVTRLVEGFHAGGGSFRFDRRLGSATLAPPAPFSGVGSFRRKAGRRNRWIGSLTLDFPGRADVPLTGGRFKATLVHAQITRGHRSSRLRPNLPAWPSTKLWPIASATSSFLASS